MTNHSHTAVRALALALALVFALSAAFAPVKAAAEGGSAEIIISDSTMDVSAKLFADPDNLVFALLAALSSEGNPVANAGIHLTEEGISISCEPFLDQAYGIHFATIEEYLPNSIFAPDSGSMFALDEETYTAIMSGLAGFKAGANSVAISIPSVDDAMVEQVEAVVDRYVALVSELVGDRMEVRVAPETVTVDDQEIETSCMTLILSNDALAAVADGVLAAVIEDSELKEVVSYLYSISLQSAATMGQGAGLPGVEIIDALWQELPSFRAEAAEAFSTSECELAISVNTSKRTETPVCLQATLTVDESSLGVRATLSEDFGTTGSLILELLEDGEPVAAVIFQIAEDSFAASLGFDDGTGYAVVAKILEDTDESFSAGISLAQNGITQSSFVLMFTLDYTESRVTVSVIQDGEESSFSCLVSEVEDDLVIVLETLDGEPLEENVRMVLHGTDNVSTPSFTEILTLSEEEFAAVLQTVMETVDSIAG